MRPGFFSLVAPVCGGAMTLLGCSLFAGQLTGSYASLPPGTQINLTLEGSADWVHWGLSGELDINRKAGVGPQISDFQILPGQENAYVSPFQYTNNPAQCSWADGWPVASVANTAHGVWMYASYLPMGSGFQFTVPADTRVRTLKVYVGQDSAQATLRASLSDNSATVYANTTSLGGDSGRVYTLSYAANSAGQKLEVRWTLTTSQGYIPYPNVHLQAAALSTPGISVLPAVSLLSVTNGESFAAGLPLSLVAAASDMDGTLSNVAFYADGAFIGAATNSPYTVSWTGAAPGFHKLTAVATDNTGERSTSEPIEVYVHTGDGQLQGSLTVFSSGAGRQLVDLSDEGTLDWVHWGLLQPEDINRSSGVTPLISTFSHSDTNALEVLDNSYCAWSWTNGTPTLENYYSTAGLQARGTTNGFEVRLASASERRRARVYIGDYGMRATVHTYFTNHSAPVFRQEFALTNIYDISDGVLDLEYVTPTPDSLVVSIEGDRLYDILSSGLRLMAASVMAAPGSKDSSQLILSNECATPEGFAFSFLTQSNLTYTVQSTPLLPAQQWTAVTNFIGSGDWVTITNPPLPGASGYYRVRAE